MKMIFFPCFKCLISVTLLCIFSEYVLIAKNVLCAEKDLIAIDDVNSCHTAAVAIGASESPATRVDKTTFPSGCYKYTDETIYFNTNSDGTRQKDSTPICKQHG